MFVIIFSTHPIEIYASLSYLKKAVIKAWNMHKRIVFTRAKAVL